MPLERMGIWGRSSICTFAERIAENQMDKNSNDHNEKSSTTLPGVVQKVIPSPHPSVPEKAEIGSRGQTICIARFASTTPSRTRMEIRWA